MLLFDDKVIMAWKPTKKYHYASLASCVVILIAIKTAYVYLYTSLLISFTAEKSLYVFIHNIFLLYTL